MAYWRKKEAEFGLMDTLIRRNPGIRPAGIARRLRVARSTVTRRLPSLEEAGYPHSEDRRRGLWPFRRPRQANRRGCCVSRPCRPPR